MPTRRSNKGNFSRRRLDISDANAASASGAHTAQRTRKPTARTAQHAPGGSLRERASVAARKTREDQRAHRARPTSASAHNMRPEAVGPHSVRQVAGGRGNASQRQAAGQPAASRSSARRGVSAAVVARRVALGAVIAVVLLVVGGVADLVLSLGKVHPGVTVQGVDVGGLSKEDAAHKLEEELSTLVEGKTVTMYSDGDAAKADGVEINSDSSVEQAHAATSSSPGSDVDGDGKHDKWKVASSTLGLYIDGAALAEQAYAVGREGNVFLARVGAWFGRANLPASVSYDNDLYDEFSGDVNKAIGKKTVESKAKIANGTAKLSKGNDGWELDQDSFTTVMSAAVFGATQGAFVAPMHTVTRHITPETAQRVVDQVNTALSGNVAVSYKDKSWTLESSNLGNFVSQKVLKPGKVLVIGGGTEKVEDAGDAVQPAYDVSAGTDGASGWVLQPYVDQEAFDKYLVELLGDDATGGARDASFYIKNGKVKIKPSKTGSGPDRQAAELQLQDIMFGSSSSQRTVALADTTVEPTITTEKAKSMGVKEKLASWSIPLSGSETRIHNIKLLCKLINGSLVAPGEVWSFNATTGERTEEKGFKKAPVIYEGRHEDQLGGGICQVATCVFNSACFSGLGIESRTNHDFYIPAYDDEGFADATVSWDVPDLQWKNDMDNYIFMSASTSTGDVVVSFWGTKDGRTVTCDRGKWKKGEKAKTITETDSELAEGVTKVEQEAVDGRKIVIHYLAKSASGEVLHDIKFNSEYVAQNKIIKKGTKKASSGTSGKSDSKKSST